METNVKNGIKAMHNGLNNIPISKYEKGHFAIRFFGTVDKNQVYIC